jgi:shikimate kinase
VTGRAAHEPPGGRPAGALQDGANDGPRNIVLIGMRASGKTTLGRELALRLGRPFTDLDDEVAALCGRPADELLAQDGERAFRAVEARVLRSAAALRGHVIATGGGAVLHGEAFAALAATGTVVWLSADPGTLLARGARAPRPALTGRGPAGEVAELLSQREPLYRAAAQIVVRSDEGEPILALLDALRERD